MKYRQTCKMTRKPLRLLDMPNIVINQCIHGFCIDCNMSYIPKATEWLWENDNSLCNLISIDELTDYEDIMS